MTKRMRLAQVIAACGLVLCAAPLAESSPPRRGSVTTTQSSSSTAKKGVTKRGSKRVRPASMRGRPVAAAPDSPAASHISQRVRSVSASSAGGRRLSKVNVNRANSVRRLSMGSDDIGRADDGPDQDTDRPDSQSGLTGSGSRVSMSMVPNARRVLRQWANNARDQAARRDHQKLDDAYDRQTSKTGDSGSDSRPAYPPNRGFEGEPVEMTLEPGTEIDRYGSQGGRYTSPAGTPYGERSLPPGSAGKPYSVYRIERPVTVQAGRVAPYYGERGGGTQFYMPTSMANLVSTGAVSRVQQPKIDQSGDGR